MDDPSGPLSLHDWRTLARALTGAEPAARRALVRLMRHHDVEPRQIWGPIWGPIWGQTGDAPPVAPQSRASMPLPAPRQGAVRDRLLAPGAAPPTLAIDDAPAATDEADAEAPDGALDFGAVAAAYPGPRWELVGPLVDLTRAAEVTALDHNAIRMTTDGPDPEATITHPSPFCEDPVQFLSVLAVLARTTPHVRLYRVQRQPDGPAAVLVKVFPDPGPETLAVLDQFHPRAADQVRTAARAVADALAHLSEGVDAADPGAAAGITP
ncbi:hypothetical protein [Roseospira goensis]|uniref:Uncharacterized protein n=1 Tax=Roseospira goensis TaxID=391922 RepID=A0A7W6RYD9_9PROT|nr:hypothetical protein [Roseospira goensis]MBB4285516.1 hypothetical protein [Roseospira goensis]